ncbi:calcium/calmodulin-regulated receptor-like kinase 1 [Nymphaea colorata]|nr:calcium/calmodulin-regulated receptor-like kinase 1 [Nymphaea colorata]
MKDTSWGLIIGISIGVLIGGCLAVFAFICIHLWKRDVKIGSTFSRRTSTIPIRASGEDARMAMSDSTIGQESPKHSEPNDMSLWTNGHKRKNAASMSGILKYSYRDLQKATRNFTTLIGQGAFGPVYKAQVPSGETVAVKVLAENSKQGEKEFETEVVLLGRLHHRNLVNLVGYCTEKGHNMLVYLYMSNGSLASHLYDEKHKLLNWDLRVLIAQDVARGLEYLHDGAVPPVVHRDIKPSNILLDKFMRARVADFGLSREEVASAWGHNIQGTFGYLDPEYVSTRSFTKKSDVYSFGVLLFELITGKNPKQGLLGLVDLAAMNTEGKGGWEEVADPRLNGDYDLEELNGIAAIAYKCISQSPWMRLPMRDVVQALSWIYTATCSRRHRPTLSLMMDETSLDMSKLEGQTCEIGMQMQESMEKTTVDMSQRVSES